MKRVLLISVMCLAACSEQAATPQAPAVPDAPAGSASMPSAPDSASGIMRIADIDFASFSRGLAGGVGLELGDAMSSVTPKVESYFSPQGGDINEYDIRSSTAKTETEFSTFGAEGGKVTLVERVNIKDDSVKAEQFYAIFKANGEDYTLADYGMKIKCYRGENTSDWQTTPCP